MNKLLTSLGLVLAVATASALAGCELYFGDHHNNDDQWSYCGSDGFYTCSGDNCTWQSATCPSGTDGGSAECGSNADCSQGCYCDGSGTCEETGFCGSDADCGSGFFCDTSRSTCEPNPTGPKCGSDADCASGSYCDTTTGTCVTSCTCTGDADAIAAGFGHCDTATNSCVPGSNPNGSCAGTVTCNTAAPTCPSGQVPLIENGCYSGTCEAVAECDTAPSCAAINDSADCTARTDCSEVDVGLNCTNPQGTTCVAGDANCTCQSFEFGSCVARTAPINSQHVVMTAGGPVDETTLVKH